MLCVLKSAKDKDAAELYASFLDSLEARTKFKKYGYGRQ
jgi:accessory colonization factor AcfC